MLSRIFFTLGLCWQYRRKLSDYRNNVQLQLPSILDLNIKILKEHNILGLVLDFDGVLASHGKSVPNDAVIDWLENLQKDFEAKNIYILSNKPTLARLQYFKDHFAAINFIIAKRKKPYPDGLQEIIQKSKLLPKQLMLIDDRLATGIVGAINCQVQALWLSCPYVELRSSPFAESFFMMLRFIERLVFRFA